LEKYRARSDIESSEDIKALIKERKIQLRQSFHARPKPNENKEPVKQGIDESDIAKITKSVVDQLKYSVTPQQPQAGIPPELVDVLRELKEAMNKPQQTTIIQQGSGSPQTTPDDDDIDIERLAELHAKAVTRQTRATEGKVDYQEKEVKGKASNNADELGDLLG